MHVLEDVILEYHLQFTSSMTLAMLCLKGAHRQEFAVTDWLQRWGARHAHLEEGPESIEP